MVLPDRKRKFFSQGRKGIMNTHRITAMAMAVALAGLVHPLAAEEDILTPPTNDTLQQNASEQKPEAESTVSEMDVSVHTFAQPTDKLLSEMKVYPSF
ncbi:MAG: hypothetical protein A3D32_02475 [Candidatus Muproteobacteria bacterium RIFCSPHIGHO2_02_FULL_60_13]|uniref:Uncharacterized protein n=1 Tax=Candidatus Muproteobacteria bacterium RIFCSPLOWO2_01_FULL_60_18 TaxID=1817768 RepID=A0A1F6U5N7_9PROT|nr:MAG: hypothetical protein A3A87_09190 [Candidatus Muproteobacteria bacterium RIFCSPLOWO2_01_FULL_60_18]OGI55259.1 MAG: hypothetical protein A3D32_02475 [Candidatus Muproteobacteria bacterium RIFCSPHIGHO2_02_FULL_60_13]